MGTQERGALPADIQMKFDILARFPNTAATIEYMNERGEVKVRTISHIKPPHRGLNWHVSVNAYDDVRQEFRTFRLDRVLNVLSFWQTVDGDGMPRVITL